MHPASHCTLYPSLTLLPTGISTITGSPVLQMCQLQAWSEQLRYSCCLSRISWRRGGCGRPTSTSRWGTGATSSCGAATYTTSSSTPSRTSPTSRRSCTSWATGTRRVSTAMAPLSGRLTPRIIHVACTAPVRILQNSHRLCVSAVSMIARTSGLLLNEGAACVHASIAPSS